MSNKFDRLITRVPIFGSTAASAVGAVTSGAYTFGVAGNCVGWRFSSPAASALNDVYFFVSAVNGTGGTVTVELRNYASATTPGSTLLASASVATPTANKWYKATFASPATLAIGTTYWLVFTSNDGTNYATVVTRGGVSPGDAAAAWASHTSANGFSTGVATGAPASGVLAFADGTTFGNPYTAAVSDAANTRERGIRVIGFDAPVAVSGVTFSAAPIASLKVYADATAPGGTALLTVSIDAAAAAIGVARFAPYTFAANTAYRVVLGYSVASSNPGFMQIPDDTTYASALEACGFAAFGMQHTVDNGAGGWTDSTDRFPRLELMVSSLPTAGVIVIDD